MKITSRVGEGTIVSMYFPASEVPPVEDAVSAAADKVVVVDDQPEVLDMASEMFRTLGFNVIPANSGREALEILAREGDVHLLFTDVVMPGMSGVELGTKARAICPGTRVLLASGYTTPAGSLQDFQFLSKPYRIADILQKLRVLG